MINNRPPRIATSGDNIATSTSNVATSTANDATSPLLQNKLLINKIVASKISPRMKPKQIKDLILEKNVVSLQAETKMTPDKRAILALPPEIDFKGTMIMVRIPAQVPDGFNLYNYMS